MTDEFNLHRFLHAQEGVYDTVLNELRAGRKSSHWIWFIFPQIAGLGRSEMAQQFAIGSLDEAKAYLQHPTLGPRLRACTQLVLEVNGRSVEGIFGYPDHLKFQSCMTLFLTAAVDNTIFKDALLKYFDGKPATDAEYPGPAQALVEQALWRLSGTSSLHGETLAEKLSQETRHLPNPEYNGLTPCAMHGIHSNPEPSR